MFNLVPNPVLPTSYLLTGSDELGNSFKHSLVGSDTLIYPLGGYCVMHSCVYLSNFLDPDKGRRTWKEGYSILWDMKMAAATYTGIGDAQERASWKQWMAAASAGPGAM